MVKNFGYWFSGLFDGEGSISVIAGERKTRRGDKTYIGRSLDTRLCISLREDDRPVLEYIKRNIGIGRVSNRVIHKKNGTDGYINRPVSYWVIDRLDDCLFMREFFKKYPLRSKKGTGKTPFCKREKNF